MHRTTDRFQPLCRGVETLTLHRRLERELIATVGQSNHEVGGLEGGEATVDGRTREAQPLAQGRCRERAIAIEDLNELQTPQQHAHRGGMPRRHAMRSCRGATVIAALILVHHLSRLAAVPAAAYFSLSL